MLILCTVQLLCLRSFAQSSLSEKYLAKGSDTVVLDSLLIVPRSVVVYDSLNRVVADSLWWCDGASSRFYSKLNTYMPLRVGWRRFSFSTAKQYQLRERPLFMGKARNDSLFKTYVWPRPSASEQGNADDQTQIETNGSISRGLSTGTNQDVFMNSNLNLQMTGQLTKSISVQGVIADNNVPFQPNGNTQQLQDFDKVFVRFFTDSHELIAGDYETTRNEDGFLKYYKKGQGAKVRLQWNNAKKEQLQTETSMAVSKGKTCIQRINTQEGNQGPYRISGCNNELYIVVLSSSERVYLDGTLLKRGEMYDYVIDYNMAEIRFTAKRLITKDSRVSVEFEYSDKNYARFLVANNTELKTVRSKTSIGLYTEFDNKNEPYQMTLNDTTKAILASAGNGVASCSSAVHDTTYNKNQVYYRKTDTTTNGAVFKDVYVYTTNKNDVRYRVSFSYVGTGKGYYQTIAANTTSGKVYAWKAPVNGVLQGDYAPIVVLIAPQKKQVAVVKHEQQLGQFTKLLVEMGASNNDKNTFSNKDDEHNVGGAIRGGVEQRIPLGGNEIKLSVNDQFAQQYFDAVAALHSSEFIRDWNLLSADRTSNENLFGAGITMQRTIRNQLNYSFENLNRPTEYGANRHSAQTQFQIKTFSATAQASWLESNARLYNTSFMREKFRLQQQIWRPIAVWYENEQEYNRWYDSTKLLNTKSYRYNKNGLFLGTADSAAKGFKVGTNLRTDYLLKNKQLTAAYKSNDWLAGGWIAYRPAAILRAQFTWRNLQIIDSTISQQKAQKTVLTVLEHRDAFFNRFLQSSFYYETGSGLEPKKEYTFVEVTPGQGTFVWNSSTDYNHDGTPQLNEFEAARYQYQANYIRVATPTTSYQAVRSSRISHTTNLEADRLCKAPTGWQNIVGRFSDKCYVSVEQKVLASQQNWWHNPIAWKRGDSLLQTLAFTFRNTLFFNKLSTVWGVNYTYQNQQNKQLTAIGFENKNNQSHQVNTRLTVLRQLTFSVDAERGTQYSMPEIGFMQNHCFDIRLHSASLKTQWQPTYHLSFSILGGITDKRNQLPDNEHAVLWRLTQENTFSHPKYGRISAQVSLIVIQYPYTTSSSIAYNMLEALQPGRNYTWTLGWQREVTKNIQINFRYEGQYLATGTTLHAGTVTAKAFF